MQALQSLQDIMVKTYKRNSFFVSLVFRSKIVGVPFWK